MTQTSSEISSDTAVEPQAPPVSLTSKAVQMIKTTLEQESLDQKSGLRIAVRGGGCSGFEYALDFDLEARPDDFQADYDGLKVFVDPISARYLDGTEIDYVFGPMGSGFKFNNPNAVGSCGCGSSFNV